MGRGKVTDLGVTVRLVHVATHVQGVEVNLTRSGSTRSWDRTKNIWREAVKSNRACSWCECMTILHVPFLCGPFLLSRYAADGSQKWFAPSSIFVWSQSTTKAL